MVNFYFEYYFVLFQYLCNIFGVLGEVEQVLEENYGLFFECFDELMDELLCDLEGV